MPDVEISIGERKFFVTCRVGEEHFLISAAKMLDAEAQPIQAQLGRLPEARMLLMAGLMLADRMASLEEELAQAKLRLAELEEEAGPAPASGAGGGELTQALARIAALEAAGDALALRAELETAQARIAALEVQAAAPDLEGLEELALRAEVLAAKVEGQVA